jgi:hypothetical protein
MNFIEELLKKISVCQIIFYWAVFSDVCLEISLAHISLL